MRFRRSRSSAETLTFSQCLARLIDELDQLSDDDQERLTRAANVLYDDRHAIWAPFVSLFVPNPTGRMVADARQEILDIWRRYHPDVPVRKRRFEGWLMRGGVYNAFRNASPRGR